MACRRLAEVLERVPRRAFLDVELKADLGRAVVEVLAAGRGAELQRAVVSSFEVAGARADPGPRPGLAVLAQHRHLRPGDVRHRPRARLRRAFRSTGMRSMPAGLARARAAGLEVAAWTVTDLRVSRRLEASGVVAMCMEGRAFAR